MITENRDCHTEEKNHVHHGHDHGEHDFFLPYDNLYFQ